MKLSHTLPLSALSLALLPAGLALAAGQDAALKLPETLISANRDVQQRDASSTASTVFTRADIERLQPASVSDLLRRVPGVQVTDNGAGSLASLYIRGTKSAQSLLLVDGMRIASASSGDSNLQFLNVDQIERVEVLRGPRSAVYGADAIGGVVQIFTRRSAGEGLQPFVRMGYGSNASWRRSAGISGGDAQTRFSLAGSLDETDGIDRTGPSYDSDQDHDAYRNKAFSLSLSHSFSDSLEAGVNVLDQRGRTEFDNPFGRFDMTTFESVGQEPYSDFTLSSVSSYLDAQVNDLWSSRLEVGHSENREESLDKLSDERGVFNTYRDSVNWLNTLALSDSHSLLLGGEWYEDQLNSNTAFAEQQRWNQAAFVQHRYESEHFSTELGVRHDKNEQFGSENTWSGALTLPLNAANDLVLSYSEGFRAPTFNDLYYPDYSNPDLKPEHSKSYELQWRSQLAERTRLEASLYRTDIEDAIASDQDFIPQNIAEARIHGFEANLQQELFGWQGQLGIAFVDPRDRDSGHTLNRRARRTLSLDLDRAFGAFAVGATWQLASSSYDDPDNQHELGGYGLLGLRGSWQATGELKLEAKIDNLLDKDYQRALYEHEGERYGYRQEGRTALLGFVWTPRL
ncbi:TonB-dependent receptor domain-containing protein [Aquipseudomonas alcaligenes]|uniref:TonB-dependent receptor n=1 Tax=Aquipseudomonas alcaligenes (strain ATCC 14909 / DSM 50342 / CCUG 1425 / JCM 20561 / NBRC 14159 / NCIMB 9945 / NCTC 10367 / 1577) TaxID=1215092 RepID=U2Z5A2_AQUA1|nr:TonB-dependent receptor [Pseudomonas alcaligenes]GAD62926.1 putative TonB-dependent receptor [Pseudomonas alcaligenes NBRC 14159]SUD19305.1 B12 family TonB-dependent receptor [Pseudomonas alcaligenes]